MTSAASTQLDAKPASVSASAGAIHLARRGTTAPGRRTLDPRIVEPEWLDQLPPAEPAAQCSRIDLQRVNAWMGNARSIVGALQGVSFPRPPQRLVDLGGGDGTLLLEVAGRMAARWTRVEAVLVDRQGLLTPNVRHRFHRLGWTVRAVPADVLEWLSEPCDTVYDVALANLFLHHFSPEPLRRLLRAVAGRARAFVACEPERSPRSLAAARLLPFIGCNQVTHHDAVVSVRAGFRGRELSGLWPGTDGWQLTERRGAWFSHLFVACHRA